jgi:hypothetical protein
MQAPVKWRVRFCDPVLVPRSACLLLDFVYVGVIVADTYVGQR